VNEDDFLSDRWARLPGMEIPPENFSLSWAATGDRVEPPLVANERELLVSFLDYHRETFALKCADLSAEQLSSAALPPSTLTLHGLARHLAGVERWWFRQQFAAEDVPALYYSDEDPDQDFETLSGDPAEAFARWRTECDYSRELVAEAALDDTFARLRDGETMSLRALLLHLITEYARHNGHADLLRERLDGATGY
jgi:uncharacterized damage-inducible protein DinB